MIDVTVILSWMNTQGDNPVMAVTSDAQSLIQKKHIPAVKTNNYDSRRIINCNFNWTLWNKNIHCSTCLVNQYSNREGG